MKNQKIVPFERVNYFSGKLLTAGDFTAEQKYLNDKRRLQNKLLGGFGVVCGMLVTRADDSSIIVDSGVAIDGFGREVVIAHTRLKRLSDIDGFTSFDSKLSSYVYLCAEYTEKSIEPILGVMDSAVSDTKFNKTSESCRLYLTQTEYRHYDSTIEKKHSLAHSNQVKDLEKLLDERLHERIYLARIHLQSWGAAYEIGKIEPLPFEQVIVNNHDLYEALKDLQQRVRKLEEAEDKPGDSPQPHEKPRHKQRRVATGKLVIEIPKGAKKGQAFYSESLAHGLGNGDVVLTLGLLNDESAVFGNPSVFSDSANYTFAARADFSDGTFQAGVLLSSEPVGTAVTLSWMAMLVDRDEMKPEPVPRIVITPGTTTLKPGGSITFVSEVYDLESSDVVWSVTESGGGHIDSYGHYTAPDISGVYAIVAKSAEVPSVSATAYVVVVGT